VSLDHFTSCYRFFYRKPGDGRRGVVSVREKAESTAPFQGVWEWKGLAGDSGGIQGTPERLAAAAEWEGGRLVDTQGSMG
jgi:hypothetical protein